jgi:hypothetical protein
MSDILYIEPIMGDVEKIYERESNQKSLKLLKFEAFRIEYQERESNPYSLLATRF